MPKNLRNLKQLADGRWEVRRNLPRGMPLKMYRRVFPSLAQATKIRDELVGAIAAGPDALIAWLRSHIYGDTIHTVESFQETFLSWIISRKGCRASTQYRYRKDLRHLVEHLGSTRLSDFRRADMVRYIEIRAKEPNELDPSKTVGGRTINHEVAVLSSLLTCAVEKGVLDTHPLVRFTRIVVDAPPKWIPTTAEVELFIDAMAKEDVGLGAISVYMAETAARVGEAIRLERPQINRRDKKVTITSESKGRRERTIPISDRALEWIDRLPPRIDQRVFTNPRTGRPWRNLEHHWRKVAASLGLKHFNRHSLRHWRCTEWLRSGIPPYIVQYLMGHASYQTTQEYVHLVRSDVDEAVRKAQGQK